MGFKWIPQSRLGVQNIFILDFFYFMVVHPLVVSFLCAILVLSY